MFIAKYMFQVIIFILLGLSMFFNIKYNKNKILKFIFII